MRFFMAMFVLLMASPSWATEVLCSASGDGNPDYWLKRFSSNHILSTRFSVPGAYLTLRLEINNDKITSMTLIESDEIGAWFSDAKGRDKISMAVVTHGFSGQSFGSRVTCQVLK